MIAYIKDLNEVRGFPLVSRVVALTLLAWAPSQIIWITVVSIFPGPEQPDYFASPLRAIAFGLLLAPILETQVMRFNFFVLKKLSCSRIFLLTANALIWGALHLHSESWGIPAVWAFFVMGAAFLKLSEHSVDRAVIATTVIHVFFNTLSYVLYLSLPSH